MGAFHWNILWPFPTEVEQEMCNALVCTGECLAGLGECSFNKVYLYQSIANIKATSKFPTLSSHTAA